MLKKKKHYKPGGVQWLILVIPATREKEISLTQTKTKMLHEK
jgi:hypothetical protein